MQCTFDLLASFIRLLLWSACCVQELMEGGDLRSRNAEVDEWGLRRFGWYQR